MQQQQIISSQINQPINNQATPNQMSNQASKIQMSQMVSNQQTNSDINQQMIDSNTNMNQMNIINQVPTNQILTQNQSMNQMPQSNQHLQQAQQIRRAPVQQNRMILTGTQIQRPGQIINQNFHVSNRIRQPNIPMQQQQSNEYYQQQNQSNTATQQPIQQTINQPQTQQFQQQTNVSVQNANNMNQMPISNNIQMAPSPGNYVASPSSNVMGSPMNNNMINQRTGPPSVPSSPNPTLNTPIMHANSSPQMRQLTNDEQIYRDKLRQLSKYIEPLKKMIIKNEDSDNANSTENQKIKSLLDIISDQKRIPIAILLRCEDVLEKMDLFNKGVPNIVPQNIVLQNIVPQNIVPQNTIPQNIVPSTQIVKDSDFCAPLMEVILNNFKKPNFNHTLQRTIGPAVAVITNNSYEYLTHKRTNYCESPIEDDETTVPHVVQKEIARLDNKFYVDLDPLQHLQSKTIHLVCKIDDIDLPCVPPILIKVPLDYPNQPPRCFIDKEEYGSSKFFQDIYKIFNNNLQKLQNLYSITTLLDRWELSIREALNYERVICF